jgi:hypothetical protein
MATAQEVGPHQRPERAGEVRSQLAGAGGQALLWGDYAPGATSTGVCDATGAP